MIFDPAVIETLANLPNDVFFGSNENNPDWRFVRSLILRPAGSVSQNLPSLLVRNKFEILSIGRFLLLSGRMSKSSPTFVIYFAQSNQAYLF